jgi:hypothetical protein
MKNIFHALSHTLSATSKSISHSNCSMQTLDWQRANMGNNHLLSQSAIHHSYIYIIYISHIGLFTFDLKTIFISLMDAFELMRKQQKKMPDRVTSPFLND